MEQTKRNTGGGCVKVIGIGCLVILMAVIAITAVIWISWDEIKESEWFSSITEMAETAKTEMGYMLELQGSLMMEYPAENILVQAQHRTGSSGPAKSLLVTFVNPAFEVPDSAVEKESKAREIALKVAELYPELERYDFVTVSFDSQNGEGVTFKTTAYYKFPTAELLVSKPLVEMLNLPEYFLPEYLGKTDLRGRKEEMEIYTITNKNIS